MSEHAHNHEAWTHGHMFLGRHHGRVERSTRVAAAITAAFMVVEIVAGLAFGSMALLADGVHMATHVGALGLAAGAYWLARHHAANTRFTFGSGKFGDLAAFSSAILLGLVAAGVAYESLQRLVVPVSVRYSDALAIAVVGLAVNIATAFVLQHPHPHRHDSAGHHHDHNLRAAYTHVLADAATSVLAILALSAGILFGTAWLDPIVGVIGAIMIAYWSYGLARESALVLLDAEDDPRLARDIRAMIEGEMNARVFDLHLWRLGPGHRGLIVSLVSPDQLTADRIRESLKERYADLSHVTVEIAVCADCGT
ncbi:MAG TPA: CDF family Co(II)/Ni(II) efflux transporter DmeF [Rhizomicrobium sp.]|jgi:cation diffusion facilitator family transporter|nr:CDF family Co(II)/Ni(II) efflux transporter DmeF [Rhizomicrobium sp.]